MPVAKTCPTNGRILDGSFGRRTSLPPRDRRHDCTNYEADTLDNERRDERDAEGGEDLQAAVHRSVAQAVQSRHQGADGDDARDDLEE
ncbi:MAG: hypothetical protein ACHREM_06160 [Polyangiales bacterium]